MTKLAENIDLSKEHTKNLTETVQTLITGLQTHGSHNTIDPASHLNEIKKKTNRTMPSKYHSNYLARESGCIRPSSSAINNLQRFTSTQDASQQSQSQLPPLQRQNAPHNGHSLSVGEQQPATAHPPRRLRQEHPSQTRNQNRHPLPQDTYFYRTPYTFQS